LSKYRQCKKIDKKPVYDVDQDIDNVVTEDIQFPEFVIERKGDIYNSPRRQQIPNKQIVRQGSDLDIFFNPRLIIKNKWAAIDVAVDNKHSKYDKN